MIHLLVVCQALAFASAYLLWDRLRAARASLGSSELRPVLEARLDDDLLPEAGPDGLASLPVRDREHQDPYRTVAELVARMPGPASRFAAQEQRIKALYQLQGALGLPDSVLDPALAELGRLALMDRPVGVIERVRPGALVDRATMRPLNTGAVVRQPLGVVVRDRDGRVLSKAKVVC